MKRWLLLITSLFFVHSAAASDRLNTLKEALQSGDFTKIEATLQTAQKSYEDGTINDKQLMNIVKEEVLFAYPGYEQQYNLWVERQPQSYFARYMRARYLYDRAFELRGGTWAKDTTAQQMKGFQDYLDKAAADLESAKKLSSKPILVVAKQIQVDAKRGKDKNLLNLLDEANKIDPYNLIVRENILNELVPRWGGSYEQMAAFIQSQKKFGLPKKTVDYFESFILADMADFAYGDQRYPEAAAFYMAAYEKSKAFDPDKYYYAQYVRSLYNKSIAEGHGAREADIMQGLNYLLADDSFAKRGWYYGIRAWIKVAQHGDLAGAWEDFQKGAELKDPFSVYKVGSTYCQGAPGIVEIDRTRCDTLLKEAAALGNEDAIKHTGVTPKKYVPNLDPDLFLPNQNPISEVVLVNLNKAVAAEVLADVASRLGKKIKPPIRTLELQVPLEMAYNAERQKYHAESIGYLEGIYQQQSPDAQYVVLVGDDIYKGEASFVFAWTLPHERRTILSVKRLGGVTPDLYLQRIEKLALRGAGLISRLESSNCVMGYVKDWIELDALSSDYCEDDKAVLVGRGLVVANAAPPKVSQGASSALLAHKPYLKIGAIGVGLVFALFILLYFRSKR